MQSGLFKLNAGDLIKGASVAVFAAIIATLYGVVVATGFDVFKADWVAIYHSALNAGVITLVSYLFKNFITDKQGFIAGAIPTK